MFIHMATAYGAVVLVMGVVGNEPELVFLGLVMMFLGNLHRLSRIIIKYKYKP